MSRWANIAGRLGSRWRKLRRDPVSFVEDAGHEALRETGLRLLVGWTHVADAFDANLRCAIVHWGRAGVRMVRRSAEPGQPERWVVLDDRGRSPPCWPRRVRIHARGCDAVLSTLGDDGAFRSGALATPSRPALLTLDGARAEFSVQFLGAAKAGELIIEPIGRAGIYHAERHQTVARPTALRRALPPGRRTFARFTPALYRRWIARNESAPVPAGRRWGPKVSVLMAVGDVTPERLVSAITSVRSQTYADWELCIVEVGATSPAVRRTLDRAVADRRIRRIPAEGAALTADCLNIALGAAVGDFIAFLDPKDRLAQSALATVVNAVEPQGVQAAYSDEDRIDGRGRRSDPSFKPGFDYERMLSRNYIGGLFMMRRLLLEKLGGFRPAYDGIHFHDMLLRLSESVHRDAIRHVPCVLYHRRSGPVSLGGGRRAELRRRLVEEHLERRQRRPKVLPGLVNRLVWPLPDPPPVVRVVIPTRDRPDLLGPCAAGVLNATDYPALELVIVDNGSRTAEARDQLAELARNPRVTLLERSGPFNFSALCNAAASGRSEGILAFVNDDVLIVEPGWLREMVSLAARPNVGAVGAKLYYPDGRIQHAGVVLGLGSEGAAGHEFRGAAGDEPGPQSRLLVTREVSAVTAGCLVVDAAKFHAVGGFDEEAFGVSFNDVDLCLKLGGRGWRTLWTPHARLIHLESATRKRGRDLDTLQRHAREAQQLRSRWADVIAISGYYHPALSRVDETFSLATLQSDPAPR